LTNQPERLILDDVAARSRKRGGWGGPRPGSGRPALFEESIDLTVRFPREHVEALKERADAQGKSAAELVREAVRKFLERGKKREGGS
jgi:hypothetical protein